jgi:hypothetical protein
LCVTKRKEKKVIKKKYLFDEDFGKVLLYAIRGAINMPGDAIDFVYSFISKHLRYIDPETLEHIKQYVWEWDTEVSNKLLEEIREHQRKAAN